MIDPIDYFFSISIPSTLKALSPDCIQIGSFAVIGALCVGLLIFHRRVKAWKQLIYACVFVEYLFLLFYITIINRTPTEVMQFEWRPLWSYQVVGERLPNVALEVILNVLLFVPLGVLMGFRKELSFQKAMLICAGFSFCIEIVQLIMKRGLCETDDLIHNLLGAILGWLFCVSVNKCINLLRK